MGLPGEEGEEPPQNGKGREKKSTSSAFESGRRRKGNKGKGKRQEGDPVRKKITIKTTGSKERWGRGEGASPGVGGVAREGRRDEEALFSIRRRKRK